MVKNSDDVTAIEEFPMFPAGTHQVVLQSSAAISLPQISRWPFVVFGRGSDPVKEPRNSDFAPDQATQGVKAASNVFLETVLNVNGCLKTYSVGLIVHCRFFVPVEVLVRVRLC